MEIYQVNAFSFRYPNAQKDALQNIQFSVSQNDFVLLYGDSGSGKTTLLRALKKELLQKGQTAGEILYCDTPIERVEDTVSVSQIGYTAQNPDVQNVAQYVKHELAFLLRNLSYSEDEIALRVAQTVSFFGTKELYRREIATLSGGEKQLVHLESQFTAEPKVLLLDEPLAQLDPFSAERFMQAIAKIKRETSVTILIASHEILPLLPYVTKVLHLKNGEGTFYTSLDAFLKAEKNASLYSKVLSKLEIETQKEPKTLGECQALLRPYLSKLSLQTVPKKLPSSKPILECQHVFFRYAKNGEDILEDMCFSLYKGEIFSIVGANGAGKSTILKVLSKREKQYMGKIKGQKQMKIAYVPQNPQAVFAFETVLEILEAAYKAPDVKTVYKQFQSKEPSKSMEISAEVLEMAKALSIEHTLYQNPFDLSGGEQQRVALAKALLEEPDILLLDECTKGLDAQKKENLYPILQRIKEEGKSILLVTHDLDFAAAVSDRTALLFDGKLLGTSAARDFFTENGMYTSLIAELFLEVPKEKRPISFEEVGYENA